VVFKYLGFIGENLNVALAAIGSDAVLPELKIRLPLGISFFTFQQMSMLWDVYRDNERQNLKLPQSALYVSLFPQLIAGPIVRYHDIIDQIRNRKVTADRFHSGVQRFILGLFRKVIIANTCAAMADAIMNESVTDLSTATAWLGALAYAMQIYFDFAGYSDMAIGLGRMLGFELLENFNFPYTSTSIKEFWRRWHISLSSWFRDYVYIPLGGNRHSQLSTYRNLIIVFFLTGLWHGATWSFVLWGLFHGAFIVIERLGFDRILARIPRPFAWIYTMLAVLVGWVFFRIESIENAFGFLSVMFGSGTTDGLQPLQFLDRERITVLIVAAIFSSSLPMLIGDRIKKVGKQVPLLTEALTTVFLIGMFLLCVLYENAGSYNPFIYFRF
jgi:alginate O-acetyltransferase complex protein AlgI